MADAFVSLHRHGEFSMYDGLDQAARAADRAVALGQSALGLTDHGGVFGLAGHYRACVERGVAPIMGAELYVTEEDEKPDDRKALRHLTVIAADQRGYANLMRVVTASYGEDLFYYKPRAPLSLLESHSDGLIVLSGCPSGLVSRALLDGDEARARRLLERMARSFRGAFWVEIMHHQLTEGTARWLVDAADRLGLPIVFTNDAHYVDREDRAVHDLILKMRGSGKGEEQPTYGYGYHMMSEREAVAALRERHPWLSSSRAVGAVRESSEIARGCSFKFEPPGRLLPKLWGDNGGENLTRLAALGMRDKGFDGRREYMRRLRTELDVVRKLGYEDYFHVCSEVVEFAGINGILIGPRGSVCGSLLAYVLGITAVDPLVHGTMFERFLHEERKTTPDVDLDIDSRHRNVVMEWIVERYAPHAVPIVTFGRYGGGNLSGALAAEYEIKRGDMGDLRGALDDLKRQRVSAISEEEADALLRESAPDKLAKQPGMARVVARLYNQVRYIGRHPGGICFVPSDHAQWFAKIRAKDRELTCYDINDVEALGLVKFDFLGLAAMSTISSAVALIRERHEEEISLDEIPLDCPSAYRAFSRGHTDGIFQFERGGAREILRGIEPESFGELAAAVALNRPGVIENLDKYVDGKRAGKTGGTLGDTYGAVVYQEQIMALLRKIGFSWSECDEFIKKAKKPVADVTSVPIYARAIAALEARGGASSEAARAFVKTVAGYSFNKAHAVGYALVAYWMMWLRTRYPLEFWVALLDAESFDDRRAGYEQSAVRDGTVLLPPHVNGTVGYSIESNAIRVGLQTIKNVGEKAARAVVDGGPYARASDVAKLPRRVVNARVIKALAESGALIMDPAKWEAHAVAYNVTRKEAKTGGWRWRHKQEG